MKQKTLLAIAFSMGAFVLFSQGKKNVQRTPLKRILTESVTTNNVVKKQAVEVIDASNVIEDGAKVDYKAGAAIVLKSGFHAKSGSIFHAQIKEVDKIGGEIVPTISLARTSSESKDFVVNVFPNPTSAILNISVTKPVKSWELTTVEGLTCFQGVGRISQELDMSTFPKGYYILRVMFVDGEIHTAKVAKK